MSKLIVKKSKLEGKVKLSGAKNSVLKLLSATILSSDKIILSNYPENLVDVKVQEEMLQILGKSIEVNNEVVVISEPLELKTTINYEGDSIRATLLMLGALVGRFGIGKVPLPGGCSLGERKFDLHIMLLEKLGAKVYEEDGFLVAENKTGNKLKGADIHLPFRSTGATENAILAGCLAEGTTKVFGPHIRPEVIDLIKMLNSMGADIVVRGQESIIINGVEKLSGTNYRVIPDNMEALTWLIGACVTGGDVEILDFPYEHLEVPLIHLRESGCVFYRSQKSLIVRGGETFPIDISTGPYPGINSDMQPLFAVYASCALGLSKIVDLRFVGRYAYADELAKIGIESFVQDNTLHIKGKGEMSNLIGTSVKALDLRAGAALMLTGLVSEGETEIENFSMIKRGYNNVLDKLISLNANVEERD